VKTSLWKDQTNFRDLLYVCMSTARVSRHDLRDNNFDLIYKNTYNISISK